MSTLVEQTDIMGKLLFGKPSRLRLGMWISTLSGRPHRTFTQKEYWAFCIDHQWPEANRSIRSDLSRFAYLEMVVERPDLQHRSRCVLWSKKPTPLWDIFAAARLVVGFSPTAADYEPTGQDVEDAKRGLLRLAGTLSATGLED